MANVPWGAIIEGSVGLANLSFIVYAVKVVIAPMKQSVDRLVKDVDSLYESRNNHGERIVKIETVHQVRGCVEPNHKQSKGNV